MACSTGFGLFLLVLLGSQYFVESTRSVDEIKIGVLIRHRGLEEPLNRTIHMLNADTSVLFGTRLVAIVELIETDNSFQASAASKYYFHLYFDDFP